MNDLLKDRIRAHRSAPDVYDPPSFEDMARRIDELEAGRAKGQADYCALMNRHDAQAVRIEELHAKNADLMNLAIDENKRAVTAEFELERAKTVIRKIVDPKGYADDPWGMALAYLAQPKDRKND